MWKRDNQTSTTRKWGVHRREGRQLNAGVEQRGTGNHTGGKALTEQRKLK